MPLDKKTKPWNQNLDDPNTELHVIYIDYGDAEKTKPCSLKFKTNELDKVIDLHKAKFNSDLKEENVLVAWEDNPSKQPGCKAILTLRKSSKKSSLQCISITQDRY